MSFSTKLKEEISKLDNLSNKEAVKYELIGYLISSNISEEKNKIKFSTENEYNINRFSRLLKSYVDTAAVLYPLHRKYGIV